MVMILWGDTPAGEAQLYFPEFNAAEIITQAESMYPAHGLRLVDPHTISCDTGGATFIPLPAGTGLLSVELPAGLHRGDRYTAMVWSASSPRSLASPHRRRRKSSSRHLRQLRHPLRLSLSSGAGSWALSASP
jgi:hypothetical protein